MNLLIIDFQKTASNQVCFWDIVLCDCDNLSESSRNDAFQLLIVWYTHHCVCLAAACLSIGENCSIIPVKDTIYEWEGALFIDQILRRVSSEDSIISETFGRFIIVLSDEIDAIIIEIDFDDIAAA